MVSSQWYNLDQDNTLGGNNPSSLKIPSQKAIKEAFDTKQDLLTAGTNISIVEGPPSEPTDTRSTATIVNAGTARWQGVAYGNGVYVAVGNSGYTAYSSDGATWSTPTQLGTNAWYSITFANGKFVAVGNNGYTTTTTDGVTWTTPVQVSGLTKRLQSVRYGNGVFVAVGFDGKSTTSTDGINWTTPVVLDNISQALSVIYNGSSFLVLGKLTNSSVSTASSAGIQTSIDGVTWSAITSGGSDLLINLSNISTISYNGSIYVVANEGSSGTYGGYITFSTNLVNWSSPTKILSKIESIYFDGTQFIAVGMREITSTTFKYSTTTSTDGQTWTTPVDIGESASSSVITYGFLSITSNGNGKFVAVGDSGATTTFEITYEQEGGTLINGAEIVSTVDSTSTNSECVGAKLFYDTCGDIETLINAL